MTTFTDFCNADSASLTVNQAGIDHLRSIVEQHANFAWTGDHTQIEALSNSDSGFDDDGVIRLELGAGETKSGNPFAYELDFEDHFDCKIDK